MVIDTHIHPALFAPICEDQERFRRRCDAMNYHLMKPSDMALLRKQYALADIGRVVLLPEDCSVESGMVEISNDEIAKLVALDGTVLYRYGCGGPPPPRCCAGAGTCLC